MLAQTRKDINIATLTVNDGIINSPEAEAYFIRADRRIMIGLRACLEMLGVPVPRYADRGKPGVTPAKEVLQAFRQDHPNERRPTAPRKPNATPDRVAEIQARRVLPTGLAAQVFAD